MPGANRHNLLRKTENPYNAQPEDDGSKVPEFDKIKNFQKVEESQVFALACERWEYNEIAAFFGVSTHFLKKHFAATINQGWSTYNGKLRRLVNEMAFKNKNPAIVMKLMCNYLHMYDKNVVMNKNLDVNPADLNEEELKKIIEEGE